MSDFYRNFYLLGFIFFFLDTYIYGNVVHARKTQPLSEKNPSIVDFQAYYHLLALIV